MTADTLSGSYRRGKVMARSDLDPIFQEEMAADNATTNAASIMDWSWSCFHCHGPSKGPSKSSLVLCICKTLKSSILHRRAFCAARRMEATGACNLEYRKQKHDGTPRALPPHQQQTFEVAPWADDYHDYDRLRSSIHELRPTRHKSCCDCIVSASSSYPLSSLRSSRTHTFSSKSSDANRTGCGEHPHEDNYTQCDNKSYSHRNSSGVNRCTTQRSFCLCNRLHPNETTSPDASQLTHLHHHNYHNQQQQQQQQQQHRSRSDDKGLNRCDVDNRTVIASYKLDHRSYEDLKTLIENFTKQVQAVSEDLVRLLEERHDVKQQIDMRNIAIEQLLRLQQNGDCCAAATTNESSASDRVAAAAVGRAKEEELVGVETIDAQQQQQQQQRHFANVGIRLSGPFLYNAQDN